jgi:hypothetical protein
MRFVDSPVRILDGRGRLMVRQTNSFIKHETSDVFQAQKNKKAARC